MMFSIEVEEKSLGNNGRSSFSFFSNFDPMKEKEYAPLPVLLASDSVFSFSSITITIHNNNNTNNNTMKTMRNTLVFYPYAVKFLFGPFPTMPQSGVY